MKLYGSKMSPFVRATLIVASELGLGERVAFVVAEGTPLDDPGLRAKNPLRKIPFLELDDGQLVYDSRVICELFVSEAEGQTLAPKNADARWAVLTRQALALGAADCAVTVSYERRMRPEEKQWAAWVTLQWAKVESALDALDEQVSSERFDLGDCAVAGLLAYLDARFADKPWREGRLALDHWFEAAKKRPSVAAIL